VTFNLADLFERVARAIPDRDAIVCGSTRRTYAELDARADTVAAALSAAGVGRGDHVGIALRNGLEYLELMLGAFKLSAVPVNVNYRYQAIELTHLLADCDARLLVHEPELDDVLADARPQLPLLATTVARGDDYDAWIAATTTRAPAVERSGDDLYVLYTGGTTGSPKGVVWRHEDIFFAAMGGGFRGGDPISSPDQIVERIADEPHRVLTASPLMHGTAHWFAFLTLFGGGTVVLSPDPALDPKRLLDLVEAEAISYVVVVGDAIAAPIADALDHEPDRWDLSTLTVVLSGGATLSAPVRRTLLEHLPWIVVVDSYGTSETGGQASAVHAPGMGDRLARGTFEPRSETVVLDDRLRPVPPGSTIVGRIARGGHVPLRYHRDPERSATTFPLIDGIRWAVTGDQATVDDQGRIVLLGRGSSTINSGGEKIHPDEVEAVLREHPAVYDAVVVGVPDPRWGERLTAVVAPRRGHVVGMADLTEHCRSRLADFKTPRAVVLVDRVRRVESGKPDHRWARDLAVRVDGVPTPHPTR
jgi:acyl-CoA synthetase (AMP-forming)/AMP-acid ligase II